MITWRPLLLIISAIFFSSFAYAEKNSEKQEIKWAAPKKPKNVLNLMPKEKAKNIFGVGWRTSQIPKGKMPQKNFQVKDGKLVEFTEKDDKELEAERKTTHLVGGGTYDWDTKTWKKKPGRKSPSATLDCNESSELEANQDVSGTCLILGNGADQDEKNCAFEEALEEVPDAQEEIEDVINEQANRIGCKANCKMKVKVLFAIDDKGFVVNQWGQIPGTAHFIIPPVLGTITHTLGVEGTGILTCVRPQ